MRTAESVVFTLWPPGPVERYTSTFRSLGSISTSTSSASGITATVAVEVWIRPCDSVSGTRCTRCLPPALREPVGALELLEPPTGGRCLAVVVVDGRVGHALLRLLVGALDLLEQRFDRAGHRRIQVSGRDGRSGRSRARPPGPSRPDSSLSPLPPAVRTAPRPSPAPGRRPRA